MSDCISLAKRGLDWSVILDELLYQSKAKDKDVWITWVGERLDILVGRGLNILIMSEVDKIRDKFFKRFDDN
ncbi:MAG: hypothetical protein ACLFN8_04885 [Candidatus Woesearchaeota archaeon]